MAEVTAHEQFIADALTTFPQVSEELETNELRFANGILQRKFIIRVRQGRDVINMTDDWRPIPSVTI